MTFADWNWNFVDLAVLGILLFGLVGGFMKGFTWQIVRLLFLALAIFLSMRFCDPLGVRIGDLTRHRMNPGMDKSLAYVLIFGVTYFGSLPLAFLLRSGIAKLKLKSYDRMVGGMLGCVKAAAVAYVLLLIVIFFAPRVLSEENRLESTVRNSFSYEALAWAHPKVSRVFPEEFHEKIGELADKVERKIDRNRERLDDDEDLLDFLDGDDPADEEMDPDPQAEDDPGANVDPDRQTR